MRERNKGKSFFLGKYDDAHGGMIHKDLINGPVADL